MLKLSRPIIPEKAIANAVEVLKSGNLIQGKYVEEFELALENYLNIKHAILVSSGTAALHVSLIALDIKRGDEIIVPAFTFPATANVVELMGAKPVLVDISLGDFCIDAWKIEEAITEKTTMIIPVHEFGQSAEIDKVIKIAEKYRLDILEDAACALGTEFNHQKVGTLGKVGCFSFHPRKTISTGEGGLVVTNDDRLAEKVKSLRNHGTSLCNGKIDFIYAGLNYRMTDFQAVLGLYQLSAIEDIVNTRIRLAKKYNDGLSKIKWIKTPAVYENRKATYQTYHVIVDDFVDRDALMAKLKASGIETNFGAQALNCLTYFKNKYGYMPEDFPNARKAYMHGLALPIGNHCNSEDVDYVVETLEQIGGINI
jgi:perosamine synthetase